MVGALLDYKGLRLLPAPEWPGTVATTLIYLAVTWPIFFLFRLIFVAPFDSIKSTGDPRPTARKVPPSQAVGGTFAVSF